MTNELNIPKEGDLYAVVTIGSHSFELRYGYCDERDRASGEPYILYPDLLTYPHFTADGYRIVSALQSVCSHYTIPEGQMGEDCCYTCNHYLDPFDEIGICKCEAMRGPSGAVYTEGGAR